MIEFFMKIYNITNIEWYLPNIIANHPVATPLRSVVASNRPALLVDRKPIKIKLYTPPKPQEEIPIEVEDNVESVSDEEVIDKFLTKSDLRIRVNNDTDDEELAKIDTTVEFDNGVDFVSEELAEIYLNQGLNSRAIDIYTQLSLLNSEKSSYFATLIEQIKQNKN